MAVGIDVVVDALPDAPDRIQAFALLDRLVGAGLVDLVGGLAVQPVVGAAEAQPLGRDDADVVGREGLAEQAGVEGVHRFVGHGLQAAVALIVDLARHRQALLHLVRVGDERDLDLVHDGRIVGQELGVEDLAVVPQAQALWQSPLLETRVQTMSRWPMCQMPSAPLTRWWICRSRIGSKSVCIFRPATSTQMASGSAVPGSTSSMSGPMISISPSLIWSMSTHGDELEGGGLVAAELDMDVLPCGCARPRRPGRRAPGWAPW